MFTTDDSKIVSGGEDCTIKIWDLKEGSLERTLKGHVDTVNISIKIIIKT